MSKRSRRNSQQIQRRAEAIATKRLATQSITTVGPGMQSNAPGTITAFSQQISSYSGPIPPPEILQGYDDLDPGRAGRLLQLAEDQSRHRMEIEKLVITADIKRSRDALRNATALGFVGLVGLVGGLAAIFYGHDVAGASAIATVLGGGAVTFITGRLSQAKERERKQELSQSRKKK